MKILTRKNSEKDMEQVALDLIMHQQNEFSIKDIINALRSACDEYIELEEVAGVVFNTFDYCLSDGIIDFVNQFSYMVNPIKQAEYINKNADNVEI